MSYKVFWVDENFDGSFEGLSSNKEKTFKKTIWLDNIRGN